ncbi:ABC-2 family transporter protein [Clostridium ragsdalei P11]|uniref:ABC-2 family transporter protein n=2 Tax=Clostridium ragsdalei TaxID=217158 RepID=A0A1A6AR69_9CLOT|nr:ABC-2 family transporter protein [Clostridium ragsdalei P11]
MIIMKEKILRFKYMITPILMFLILGIGGSIVLALEFSAHSLSKIPTIIVNHDNSSSTQTFIREIRTNSKFNVVAYSQTDNDVKDLIDKGDVAIGFIIPKHFSKDLTDGKNPKIMVVYDGAQMAMTSSSRTRVAQILGTIKSAYLINVAEEKLGLMPEVAANYINPIRYNSRIIGNPIENMFNFFIPGFSINIIQVGMIIVVILLINKGNSYKKMWIKGIMVGLLASISVFIILAIYCKYFGLPYRGFVEAGIMLTILFCIGMTFVGVLLSILFNGNQIDALGLAGPIAITLFLVGYTFPTVAMPDIIPIVAKYIPFYYYAVPLRDLSLIGGSFQDNLSNILWLTKFMIFMWVVTFLLYKMKEAKRLRNIRINEKNSIINSQDEEVIT